MCVVYISQYQSHLWNTLATPASMMPKAMNALQSSMITCHRSPRSEEGSETQCTRVYLAQRRNLIFPHAHSMYTLRDFGFRSD